MTKRIALVRLNSEQSPEPVPSHGGPAVLTNWTLSIEGVILKREFDRRHWVTDRAKRHAYTLIEHCPSDIKDLYEQLCEVFDAPEGSTNDGN